MKQLANHYTAHSKKRHVILKTKNKVNEPPKTKVTQEKKISMK